MKIHVAARNEDYAKRFLKNNPDVADVVVHLGATSLFTLLQSIIDYDDDYALFVHDDVFLPSAMNGYVSRLIKSLNTDWPNWGICGNAGIVAPTLTNGARGCRYLFDPHGGPSFGGYILPAETIDGNTILINCRALRKAKVQLPRFEGFQFYDISLSVETLAAGLAVLIAPDLACYHNSKGNQSEFDRAFDSKTLKEYLSSKLSNRVFVSLNGILKLPFTDEKQGQFDICKAAVKNASVGRPDAKIAFVIRSQFCDVPLLLRAVTSTLAFAAATHNHSIKTYVVTKNSDHDAVKCLPSNISLIATETPPGADTRNLLIKDAVNSISEDFVLFLDDDDWVFPNDANYISDLLTCLPATANLVVDSQHFTEPAMTPRETDWQTSSPRPQRRFFSRDWPLNFTGNNYVPLCGAFYSREILLQQPKETYEKITYYEDYTVSLFALLNANSVFFSAPRLVSGISIRRLGSGIANMENITNKTKWNQSQAELAHHLCANTSNNVAFSIGERYGALSMRDNCQHIVGVQYTDLSWLDRRSIAISRFLHGLLAFFVRPDRYASNLKSFVRAVRSGGVRGVARCIADLRGCSQRKNSE